MAKITNTTATKNIEDMTYDELMAMAKAKKAQADDNKINEIENVKVERKGKSLIITVVDMDKIVGESKSGKSDMIATTHGFVSLGGGMALGLNITKKK